MKIVQKDILTVTDGIIGQQVNCQGVMGAGLAWAIQDKWPVVYHRYRHTKPALGLCDIVFAQADIYVANLYGQDTVGTGRRQTNYGALSSALSSLRTQTKHMLNYWHVYLPHGIGCGLGGGDWEIVHELIEFYLPDAIICIYDQPPSELQATINKARLFGQKG